MRAGPRSVVAGVPTVVLGTYLHHDPGLQVLHRKLVLGVQAAFQRLSDVSPLTSDAPSPV